jgi:competence protein ComGC
MLTGRYGLSGAMYQRLSSLYALGWSVNSFFTAIADTFAIFGYTKRWYCVFCTLGGGVFALLYALLPAKESSAKPAAAFMFLTALFLANVDTFAQAIYSRRIRRNPASRAALVSSVLGEAFFGLMISAAVQALLTDKSLTNVSVCIVAGILSALSLLFIVNLLGDHLYRVATLEDATVKMIAQQREERAVYDVQRGDDVVPKNREVAFVESGPASNEGETTPEVVIAEREYGAVGCH